MTDPQSPEYIEYGYATQLHVASNMGVLTDNPAYVTRDQSNAPHRSSNMGALTASHGIEDKFYDYTMAVGENIISEPMLSANVAYGTVPTDFHEQLA